MTELLHSRFEIVDELGRGAQAVTYRAIDHDSGDEVALKELDFRRVSDWKAHELFQREGETLRSLDHPAIPRYVDAFLVADGDEVRLFLAQEYVRGSTLADELDSGGRWSERELVDDCRQLLDALAYLQSLSPPVVHRDIKPSNIMRRPDGTLALIDFGAVQNALPKTVGGSTVIGTPGYMPMEQLMGRALPATDIYALGATLVHLVSGVEPSKIDVVRNRLRFRDVARLSDDLADILDQMLAPSIEDRYQNADDVIEALRRLDGGLGEETSEPGLLEESSGTDDEPGGGELAPVPASTRALAGRRHVAAVSKGAVVRAVLGIGMIELGAGAVYAVAPFVSTFASVLSTAGIVGISGWLGARVLKGHPSIAKPGEMQLNPLVKPVAIVGGTTAVASSLATVSSVGGDFFTGIESVAWLFSSAFYAVVLVVLGFAAGCAYRVFSHRGASR